MKKTENVEEPDDFGRSIVVKNDYVVDLSKSSCEEWLKDNNLVDASSEKDDVKLDSDVVIEIDITNGEIHKKEEGLDVTVGSTASVTSNSVVCKDVKVGSTVSVTSNSEVGKKEEKLDETVGSMVSLMSNSEVHK